MTDIWRHRINLDTDGPRLQFDAPSSAYVISAQLREGTSATPHVPFLDLWFEVSDTADAETSIAVGVSIVGTGTRNVPVDGWFRFMSTIQVAGGAYVFHVYVDDGKTGQKEIR